MSGIIGDRCVLTAIELTDLEMIRSWQTNPDVWRMTMGYRFPITSIGIRAWYDQWQEDHDSHSWAIRIQNEDVICGMIALTGVDHVSGIAELSVVVQGERHLGLGTDAVNTICLFAKEELRLRRIWLRVRSENARALSLYKRTGFIQEGCLKGHFWAAGHFDDVLILAKQL